MYQTQRVSTAKLAPVRELHHVHISIQYTQFPTQQWILIYSDRCSQHHKKGICFIRPSCTTETSVWISGRSILGQMWCNCTARMCVCEAFPPPPLTMCRLRQSTSAVSWCRLISVVFSIPWISSKLPWKWIKNKENRLNLKTNLIICRMLKKKKPFYECSFDKAVICIQLKKQIWLCDTF